MGITAAPIKLPVIGDGPDDLSLARLQTIGPHLDSIRELCRDFGIDRLEVFGSEVSGLRSLDSDVDFIVYYPDDYDFGPVIKRYFDFQAALATLLNRQVDLVMASAIRSDGFARMATQSRRLIYARR